MLITRKFQKHYKRRSQQLVTNYEYTQDLDTNIMFLNSSKSRTPSRLVSYM